MKNVVLLNEFRKILEAFMLCIEKSWKLYENENSENLDDRLHTSYFKMVKLLH